MKLKIQKMRCQVFLLKGKKSLSKLPDSLLINYQSGLGNDESPLEVFQSMLQSA